MLRNSASGQEARFSARRHSCVTYGTHMYQHPLSLILSGSTAFDYEVPREPTLLRLASALAAAFATAACAPLASAVRRAVWPGRDTRV